MAIKTKGTYKEIINSITKENIPNAWIYDMDNTVCCLLIAMLEKFKDSLNALGIEKSNDMEQYIKQIDFIIGAFKKYTLNPDNTKQIGKAFRELQKIFPSLWI